MSTNSVCPNIIVDQDLVGDYVLEFKEEIVSVIDSGESDLVIDMGQVRILGSSAIGVLASAMNTLRISDGSITLVGLNSEIKRVLKLMGMANTFKLED